MRKIGSYCERGHRFKIFFLIVENYKIGLIDLEEMTK